MIKAGIIGGTGYTGVFSDCSCNCHNFLLLICFTFVFFCFLCIQCFVCCIADCEYHEWGSTRAGRNNGVNIQWTTVHAHNNESVYRAG